ncbi:protein lethal(2)essential for life-like [Pectinophora gossypiella]|uniref:protein lethal(2)essential for life-like n=1 Tax=Pectinophora gossypiella TaxID=13191 RepID=UPI00214E5999|nr:protein lethal(2)essential for life-like [Pectinophora gossypiella]
MKNLKLVGAFALVFLSTGILADDKCPQSSGRRSSLMNQMLPDQDFGLSFGPHDFLSMMSPFVFRDYYRPWRRLAALTKDLGSTIKTDKDQFSINLDVQHFSPDEITVKTVDGYVVIEAKHEEKQDEHGYISRQFVRRYSLPEGTEPDSVVSQLSSDGVLTVTAPRKAIEGAKERIIPITQTGPIRKEAARQKDTCESDACVSDE